MPIKTRSVDRKDYSSIWKGYSGDTVSYFLDKWREEIPDHEALVYKDTRVSWKSLGEITDNLATGLLKLGLKKGERIGILTPNHPEAVYTWYAAAKVGIVPVPLSTRYRRQELSYVLKDSGVSALVSVPESEGFSFLELIGELKPSLPNLKHVITYPQTDPPGGLLSLYELMETQAEPEWIRASAPRSDELLFILYTSGTTGEPKGVMHTHDTFLSYGKMIQEECWHLTKEDPSLLAIPISHAIGHELMLNGCLIVGAKLVMMESYNPIGFVELLEKEKVAHFVGVPTMYMLPIMRVPDIRRRDLSAFRLATTCGFYAPEEQMRQFRDTYEITLLQLMGSTEGGGLTTTYPGDREEVALNSVGRPLPMQELKIVDQNGNEVAEGEIGELWHRGPNICVGYWNKPEQTRQEIDEEGYWHSGDMGYQIDEEGNIRLVGRKKDVIKRGGFNIYGGEIENYLVNTPKILEAAVVSYPDPVLGEKVCAYVVLKPGQETSQEEVVSLCKDNLADYKAPDMVKVVSQLPKLPSGKVDKVAVKEQLLKELEGADATAK